MANETKPGTPCRHGRVEEAACDACNRCRCGGWFLRSVLPGAARHEEHVSDAGDSVSLPIVHTRTLCAPRWQHDAIRAAAPKMLEALREIVTICTESQGECRKRMGTRAGNSLVAARAALALAEGR